MRPVLPNTSREEVEAFRAQVQPIVMIGCTDVDRIHARVRELAAEAVERSDPESDSTDDLPVGEAVERVIAEGVDPMRIKLDKAGYFVINVEPEALLVEHYSYKDELLRVIEGEDARSIYLTIVRNGWVSQLDHAAYLGKELARAEMSMRNDVEYVQDGG